MVSYFFSCVIALTTIPCTRRWSSTHNTPTCGSIQWICTILILLPSSRWPHSQIRSLSKSEVLLTWTNCCTCSDSSTLIHYSTGVRRNSRWRTTSCDLLWTMLNTEWGIIIWFVVAPERQWTKDSASIWIFNGTTVRRLIKWKYRCRITSIWEWWSPWKLLIDWVRS